ncbi:MAG TPA: hypothetical protein VIA81_03895 [Acidimicrobiia bacterium]|jgi:hypothetical protein
MSTATQTPFIPSLGLVWRGMWGVNFATAVVVATTDDPDDDDPAEVPAA